MRALIRSLLSFIGIHPTTTKRDAGQGGQKTLNGKSSPAPARQGGSAHQRRIARRAQARALKSATA